MKIHIIEGQNINNITNAKNNIEKLSLPASPVRCVVSLDPAPPGRTVNTQTGTLADTLGVKQNLGQFKIL